MKCPHCSVDLLMTERKNIEIDYCPKCRGVWLDRGELDKLIESNSTDERYPGAERRSDRDSSTHHSYEHRSHDDRRYDKEHYDKGHYKKRRGWLGEIFDFD